MTGCVWICMKLQIYALENLNKLKLKDLERTDFNDTFIKEHLGFGLIMK